MTLERTACDVAGTVQGVGFRPYVARLAHERGLVGWVANVPGGVRFEIEGDTRVLTDFFATLGTALPLRARIDRIDRTAREPAGETAFRIEPSLGGGQWSAPGAGVGKLPVPVPVAADGATCAACLAEVMDPGNRRHRYSFTSCTDCGPRYSVLESLPYDRANTSMRAFEQCAACRAEVESMVDRRSHAQANACPDCGPCLSLLDAAGATLQWRGEALDAAVAALDAGNLVAVLGLGGFQLLCDATDAQAVRRLRRCKSRPHKPFALLVSDVAAAARVCKVSRLEARTLGSSIAPIVLLSRRRAGSDGVASIGACGAPRGITRGVAPASRLLGVMLPCTPLHHLLARGVGRALVVTSGNRSGAPMAIRSDAAVRDLAGIADLFLVHDRPVVRALDDSIVRLAAGRVMVLRRARGLVPFDVTLPFDATPPFDVMDGRDAAGARRQDGSGRAGTAAARTVLALGGHQKSALAVASGRTVVIGEHLGDLDAVAARRAFEAAADTLPALHGVRPGTLARDRHPDYFSSQAAASIAQRTGCARTVAVPHHVAHVLSCLADNGIDGPALGVAWDGSGDGGDGTVWGGEFLRVDGHAARRVAHLHPMRLPGGERAVVEPRRAALGALHALYGANFSSLPELEGLPPMRRFTRPERALLQRMLERGINAPWSTSAGRLFDAAASLLGLVQCASFEGQAAMMLEQCCDGDGAGRRAAILPARPVMDCPIELRTDAATEGKTDAVTVAESVAAPIATVDWRPALRTLLAGRAAGRSRAALAREFHTAMIDAIVTVARLVGEPRVALTGGCFQNARLLGGTVRALDAAGFEPLWHRRLPPNDGGLALGQAVFATRWLQGARR